MAGQHGRTNTTLGCCPANINVMICNVSVNLDYISEQRDRHRGLLRLKRSIFQVHVNALVAPNLPSEVSFFPLNVIYTIKKSACHVTQKTHLSHAGKKKEKKKVKLQYYI